MSKTFRPWDVDQVWLLPPSIQDLVPSGHMAHFVRDTVRTGLGGCGMKGNISRTMSSAALIVGFFLVWEILCILLGISDVLLPKPSQIFLVMWERWPALLPHALQTLYTTMVGFAWGVVLGIAVGVLIGSFRVALETAR